MCCTSACATAFRWTRRLTKIWKLHSRCTPIAKAPAQCLSNQLEHQTGLPPLSGRCNFAPPWGVMMFGKKKKEKKI